MPDLAGYWTGIRYLEFGGGGQTALSALGAVAEVLRVDPGLPKRLLGVSGCSAGGVVAVFLAVNSFDVDRAMADVRAVPWSSYKAGPDAFTRILAGRAMHGPGMAETLLGDIVRRRLGSRDATLATLHARTGLWVRLRTADLITGTVVHLDHHTRPELRVIDALWASAAVPLAHEAVTVPRPTPRLLVDGAMLASYSRDSFFRPAATHGFAARTPFKEFWGRAAATLARGVRSGEPCHFGAFLACCAGVVLGGDGSIGDDRQTTLLQGCGSVVDHIMAAHRGPLTQACLDAGRGSQRRWFERELCVTVVAVMLAEHIL